MKALIFSMTCGEGHNLIAKSLADQFSEHGVENKIAQVFGFDEKRVAKKNAKYLWICKHFPHTYNKIWNALRKRTRKTNKLPYYCKVCFPYVKQTIEEFKPDIIVCTHYYASSVISYMKKHNMLDGVLTSTILFDFCLAPYWEHSNAVDYIFEPLDNTTEDLIAKGYVPKQIVSTGLPIRSVFAEVLKQPIKEVRKQLKLPDKFTLLITGGGNSLGNTLKLLKNVLERNLDINIIVINGKNKKNFDKVQQHIEKNNISNVLNLGFVSNMQEYMYSADAIICRCGGGSISEILALGKPFIVREKLINNEEINKKFFIREGCALGMKKITDAGKLVDKLYKNPELCGAMAENIKKFSRPNSSKDIVEFLISKK